VQPVEQLPVEVVPRDVEERGAAAVAADHLVETGLATHVQMRSVGRGGAARRVVHLEPEPGPPMTTVQEIEKAIEALPLADQLRLYRDTPW
jgi:hypothetical protein